MHFSSQKNLLSLRLKIYEFMKNFMTFLQIGRNRKYRYSLPVSENGSLTILYVPQKNPHQL